MLVSFCPQRAAEHGSTAGHRRVDQVSYSDIKYYILLKYTLTVINISNKSIILFLNVLMAFAATNKILLLFEEY